MKKNLITILLASTLIFISAGGVRAATNYQANPGLCPSSDTTIFPGQNCAPLQIIGDSSGTVVCGSGSGITAPGSSAIATLYTAGLSGYGYNCYGTSAGSGNIICTEDSSCRTMNRDTTCTASSYQSFSCTNCKTGYGDCNLDGLACEVQFGVTNYPAGSNNNYLNCTTAQCDTNYYDCDASGAGAGNGCEQQNNIACTDSFGNPGTISCTANAGGSCTNGVANYNCTCNVAPINFLTGVNTTYGSTTPLLQGTQTGTGPLAQFGNSITNNLFSILNDGSVFLSQITAPAVTTDLLYNVGGNLFWDGTQINLGSVNVLADADNDTKIQVEKNPDEDIIRFDTAGTEVATLDSIGDFTLNTGSFFLTLGDIFFGAIGLHDTGTSSSTSGASQVGVYNTTLTNSTGTDVQQVLEDLDNAITSGVNVNKTIILTAEYSGYTIVPDGTNNAINLYSGHDALANKTYYDTSTGATTIQDVNVIISWPLPDDFVSWDTTPLEFYYKTDSANAGDNYIQLATVYDTTGTPVSTTPPSATQYTNTSWTKQGVTYGGTPTWTPNGNIILDFKFAQKYTTGSERAVLGEIIFHYIGKQ